MWTLETWTNFGKQQGTLMLYQTMKGILIATYSNTPKGNTVVATHATSILPMIQSVALQSFLATPTGAMYFPAGFDDPRIAYLRGVLTFLSRMAIRELMGVVPHSNAEMECIPSH